MNRWEQGLLIFNWMTGMITYFGVQTFHPRNGRVSIFLRFMKMRESFISGQPKKFEDLKQMLDSGKDSLKLEAMKRIIGMLARYDF